MSNISDVNAMHPDVLFRRLSVADLPAVAEIEADVHIEPWSHAQVLEVANLLDAHYVAWVAERASDGVQAYLIAQMLVDELEILTIGASRAVQGQGIGTALLDYALNDVRRSNSVVQTCFLEVRVSNHAARALYDKQGFLEVGRRKNYYHDPVSGAREDALILRRDACHDDVAK